LLANRWVLLAAIPLFLALVAESFLSVRFAMDEREQQAWVIHTYQVIDRLQGVLNDVQEAETGQRGFIITRQDRFLQPYRDGIGKAQGDLKEFRHMTADNPSQQARARMLDALVRDRFKALDATLASTTEPSAATPQTLAAMDQGKRKMDGLRVELARGMAEEDRLLRERSVERHRVERNEVVATSLAAVVALFVILGTALLLVRSNVNLAKSEQKLANESAILQTTLDTIRDGIAMFASDGELCVFNESFFKLAGFPDALAHKGASRSEFEAFDKSRAIEVLADGQGRNEGAYRRVSIAGRELDVYRASVPTGGFIIVCMDVTARLLAEQTARQVQKMEAIGHLTGGVAHDFNNLLQIIGSNLERTVADLKGDTGSLERVQNAIDAVARGARLTGQLLAFARRQALDPRSTNVGRVIQDMTDLLRRTLGERVEVECIIAGGLWNTFVDPGQIESAILNLAINARDAMPDGGKLTLEVANAFLDDAYAAQHSEVTSGQYVMVGISDTGEGMAPDVIARAFEPFFTTKPEGRGTGLGLSQVYGFVKQSGGHIKIYSEMGQGTTVKLYLPRTRKPQEGTGPVSTGPVEGGSERILVVEDDAQVRAAAVDSLTELGYSVLKAENAEQALAILGSGALVDVLFTDVVMPGPIKTRDLARRAQEMQPNILVLYTSGYTQNAIVHNGKLDEDAVLLSKPYRREELARKLRMMLDGRRNAASGAAAVPAPAAKDKAKVLVVEDIALIRMTTVEMVEEIGFAVAEAGAAPEALSLLENDPAIGVLLTDLGLPGMSGRELVEKALQMRPDLRVVVVSGYASEPDSGKFADRFAHLMKPFDIEQLRRVLEA
jgi:signal transduction histidine kinase/CHASE3 domain sensor protein/DNA-binding response OmpR family regulator